MNTDDTRAAFEKRFGPNDSFAWRDENDNYKVAALQHAWEVWQAATEAAKATGTAGEPHRTVAEIDSDIATGGGLGRMDRLLKERARAEAARQPALISTVPGAEDFDPVGLNPYVVQEADIVQKFPLNDEQIDKIARAYFAEEYAQTHVKNAIHDAFVEAAPNRSQPCEKS